MSSLDLARARTDLADAVFLLADTTTTNTEEDDSVTVLYWSTMGCGTSCGAAVHASHVAWPLLPAPPTDRCCAR